MEKAKKKRASHRRNVTKLVGKVKDLASKGAGAIDVVMLKHFQRELEDEQNELKEFDNEILEVLYDEDNDDEVDKEMEEASNYKERILRALLTIEDALEKSKPQQNLNSPGASNTSVPSAGSSAGNRVNVRLPKLELTKFGGQLHRWQEFWDGYSSAVHENNNLANANKFKYLRSLLEEPARSVVAGLPLMSNNYETAIKLLQDRYGDPVVIQRAHINQLAYLPSEYSERNTARLRSLHDQIETHYRGLEALDVDQNTYSTIFVPMLMEKIPDTIRFNMIRGTEKRQVNWGIDDLLKALSKELEIRESHGSLLKHVGQEKGTRPRREDTDTTTASTLFVSGGKVFKGKCVYCLKEHTPEDCSDVKDVSERKGILIRQARCFCVLECKTPCV